MRMQYVREGRKGILRGYGGEGDPSGVIFMGFE
jgi:hypothetical protein